MRLVHFGCWGDYKYIDGINKNLEHINQLEITPDILSVAGDNYYSKKTKETYRDKKIRKFNEGEFDALFNTLGKLTHKIPNKYLLLGNHEFDIFDKYREESSFLLRNQFEFCEVHKFIPYNSLKYELVNDPVIGKPHTLIIMIDSNLFSGELEEVDLETYKRLNIYNSGEISKELSKENKDLTLEDLKQMQEKQIRDLLDTYQVNDIIMIGHHPIKGCKVKGKGEHKESYAPELHNMITRLGNKFINCMNGNNKFYYLCADVHCYQQVDLTLDIGDGKNLFIEQHIVGTGGADFDVCPFIYDEPLSENGNEYKLSKKACKNYSNISSKVITSYSKINGYLLCDYKNGNWNFEFVKTFITPKEKNESNKKNKKKNKKKTKKTGNNKTKNNTMKNGNKETNKNGNNRSNQQGGKSKMIKKRKNKSKKHK